MTENLISQTNNMIGLFIKHLGMIKHFPEMSKNKQEQLMFDLRSDSIALNRMLSEIQNLRGDKQ